MTRRKDDEGDIRQGWRFVAAMAALFLTAIGAGAASRFKDHGAPVPLAEKRGAVAMRTKDGRNIVIACSLDQGASRWVLVTDIDSGKSRQVWEPKEAGNKETYSVLLSSKGRFYTATGGYLLELDVEKLKWTVCVHPADVPLYLSFTEGRDGTIYAGGYETCHLAAIDPASGLATDLGLMDPREMYLSRLATDDKGWVYCADRRRPLQPGRF